MTPTLDRETRIRGLQELGVVVPDDFVAIQKAPIARAQEMLVALKAKVRHNFHRLSLVLHPDHNGGDAAKTERFKVLAIIKAQVDQIEAHAQERPTMRPMPVGQPHGMVVHFRMPNGSVVSAVPVGVSFKVPFYGKGPV